MFDFVENVFGYLLFSSRTMFVNTPNVHKIQRLLGWVTMEWSICKRFTFLCSGDKIVHCFRNGG